MKTMILALTCLSAAGLQAQTHINGGMQVGLMAPTGDFADKKDSYGNYYGAHEGLGFHVGGHLDLDFTQHSQLRLHMTAMGFASKEHDLHSNVSYYDGTYQNTFGVFQVGADYVHNFESPNRGGYFLAGLSLNHVKETVKYTDSPYYYDYDYNASQSGRLGVRIGGGYTFNRVFSLEGHLDSISVDKNGADGFGFDAITFATVSAVFRFGR